MSTDVSDFLKNLPIHNSENFTKLNASDVYSRSAVGGGGQHSVTSRHRPALYVPTTDYPSEQVRSICKSYIMTLFCGRGG